MVSVFWIKPHYYCKSNKGRVAASGGFRYDSKHQQQAMRLFCLCAFRDASAHLKEFMDCLRDHFDGVLFFDDCSSDNSVNITQHDPIVWRVMQRREPGPAHKFESQNRLSLLKEAAILGGTHCLVLDADERLELGMLKGLRKTLETVHNAAFSVHLRDLWGGLDRYRTDGVWALKRKVICFPLIPEQIEPYYQPGVLHQPWMPPTQRTMEVKTTFNLYHLGSITPEMRKARVAKFEQIDSEHKFQADYSYLACEQNLQLETIPAGRGWTKDQ
jgi:hypothetical protein